MTDQDTPNHQQYLTNLKIEAFNPMQLAMMERAVTLNNIMLLAPTGSGKTLAFLVPMVDALKDGPGVQAIIVAPSRELVLQIEQVFRSIKTSYKITCCYGGHSMKIEENSLADAPAVLIATPGRLADHIERKSFSTAAVKMVVLDEFDKSLQMGFHDQLKTLFSALSGKQQHILTSATTMDELPPFLPFKKIETLNYLLTGEKSKLKLKLVKTKTTDKAETLMRLVAGFNQEVSLVFCNHREAVERISEVFRQQNFEHGMLHGAMEQIDREKSLIRFRGGAHTVLIATDLASRGLDIPEIKHVIHYQLPPKEEAFIHRNGRTARMAATGEAYLILAEDESLPDYMDTDIPIKHIPTKLTLPPPPAFACLYISAGKKDKISKGDIAGLLMKKAGLHTDEVGLITTLDHASYASVTRSKVPTVLKLLRNEKLKKLKVKIEVAS